MQTIISPNNIYIDKGNQIFDGVFQQSLGFRIKMDYDTAVQFIRRIGGYNEFQPDNVINALECIDRLIPRSYYNEGNPNNGRRQYEISVGREGSPVIYLDLHEWAWDKEVPEESLKTICSEMELIGKADESEYDMQPLFGGGRNITFRFWWD